MAVTWMLGFGVEDLLTDSWAVMLLLLHGVGVGVGSLCPNFGFVPYGQLACCSHSNKNYEHSKIKKYFLPF